MGTQVTLQHVPMQCQDMARSLGSGDECPGEKSQFWVMGSLPKEKQFPHHPTPLHFQGVHGCLPSYPDTLNLGDLIFPFELLKIHVSFSKSIMTLKQVFSFVRD